MSAEFTKTLKRDLFEMWITFTSDKCNESVWRKEYVSKLRIATKDHAGAVLDGHPPISNNCIQHTTEMIDVNNNAIFIMTSISLLPEMNS